VRELHAGDRAVRFDEADDAGELLDVLVLPEAQIPAARCGLPA